MWIVCARCRVRGCDRVAAGGERDGEATCGEIGEGRGRIWAMPRAMSRAPASRQPAIGDVGRAQIVAQQSAVGNHPPGSGKAFKHGRAETSGARPGWMV
jgi:hypothetical protein